MIFYAESFKLVFIQFRMPWNLSPCFESIFLWKLNGNLYSCKFTKQGANKTTGIKYYTLSTNKFGCLIQRQIRRKKKLNYYSLHNSGRTNTLTSTTQWTTQSYLNFVIQVQPQLNMYKMITQRKQTVKLISQLPVTDTEKMIGSASVVWRTEFLEVQKN